MTPHFYIGLHQPNDAHHFARCMISIKRLWNRQSTFAVQEWMIDSGAFTELRDHGCYRASVDEYARQIRRWVGWGRLMSATSQDYMCEPFILERTGLTIADHQRLTIARYDALRELVPDVYILPVLQGYDPADYAQHVTDYGDRLALGAWVGVGSVCKRNGDPAQVVAVLGAIKAERPDLRLHGFGLKLTALGDPRVCAMLHSADSMAWSLDERRSGRSANHWTGAMRYVEKVNRVLAGTRHDHALR